MQFRLADPSHEPQLRALLRQDDMPGWVRLRFEREPDYFHAAATQGGFHQTIVALDGDTVVGTGSRAIRELWIDGTPQHFGYLGGLRSRPEARGHTGLARGYAFLKRLHDDGLTRGYLTTVIDANSTVRELLTSGRAGLPNYRDLGVFHTYSLAARRRTDRLRGSYIAVGRAAAEEWPEIVAFLAEHAPRRQFFPVVRTEDLGTPLWRGLRATDFFVARDRDGRVLGTLASWDQSSFKQTRVTGYPAWLRATRPLVNVGLRAAGLPRLPRAGALLQTRFLCLICIRDDAPGVLGALLDHACAHAADQGADQVCLGLHERDPLTREMDGRRALRYTSRVYHVSWDDGCTRQNGLDPHRPPHLEVALL
jgi:hypothetical protein